MYKLVILFETPPNEADFQQGWQEFMRRAEQMPGLLAETVSDVQGCPFDPHARAPVKIHELHFASQVDLETALQSPAGQEAGRWLHTFTGGRFILLTARHMQASIKEFTKPSPPA